MSRSKSKQELTVSIYTPCDRLTRPSDSLRMELRTIRKYIMLQIVTERRELPCMYACAMH